MTDRMDITGAGHAPALFPAIATLPRVFGAKVVVAMRALQLARMKSILSQMSDYQLAEIGIKRSQIAAYATTLMAQDAEH